MTARLLRISRCDRLAIFLIRPSKYDDDGYVIRHWRGVLPSNTLACLSSLTEDLKERKALGDDVSIEVQLVDDTVQKIPYRRILRSHRPPRRRTVVALVGVQSNQFPRAADLALRFRRAGLPVLIGGFHVSGTASLFSQARPEVQQLKDAGVSVVLGEVEATWGEILDDAVHDRLKGEYNYLACRPDISQAPVPRVQRSYLKRFVASNFGTIDCGRGCPFNCSFCTIINVQGRKMRFRSVETVEEALRQNYARYGVDYYFFTDDNFSRNACWREIFLMISRLREKEGIPIGFMMQVDAASYRIPDFVQLAARAGCTQVFVGMESINPRNLTAAGKAQNKVENYKALISSWHDAGIAIHAAYIIGFPFDSPESVEQDIARLKGELKVDQASFFMLTPLPGSQDHAAMVRRGEYMDADLNRYDSFHETTRHPNFAPGEWYETYRRAWHSFYSFEYMRNVLMAAPPQNYWNIFRNFIWYKNSAVVEEGHPMIHGFFRLRDRVDRRPGYEVEPRRIHWVRRVRELRRLARAWTKLMLEMEELWLQTRIRSEAELRLVSELRRVRAEVNRKLRVAELELAHVRARVHVPDLHIPSRLALALRHLNLASVQRITYSRADLAQFWKRTLRSWRAGAILRLRPHRIAFHLLRDLQLFLIFVRALMRAERNPAI
jgi:radical SAM superfamily enzyme YgiQ (UPF0313 family)